MGQERKKQCFVSQGEHSSFPSNSPRRNMYYLYFDFYIFRINSLVHISLLVDTFGNYGGSDGRLEGFTFFSKAV